MRFAIISVFDKKDIVKLAVYLIDRNYSILATRGTASFLKVNMNMR